MHVVSGDRFVSFKAGGDRRDGSFFFYRAGIAWPEGRSDKKSRTKKLSYFLFFLVVEDLILHAYVQTSDGTVTKGLFA